MAKVPFRVVNGLDYIFAKNAAQLLLWSQRSFDDVSDCISKEIPRSRPKSFGANINYICKRALRQLRVFQNIPYVKLVARLFQARW